DATAHCSSRQQQDSTALESRLITLMFAIFAKGFIIYDPGPRSSQIERWIAVDAYSLATDFTEFVQREWSDPLMEERAGPIEKGHLWGFFQDWADEIDLLCKVAGNQVMALQTWIIVSAWFAQKPEDFSAIRKYVTVPL